MTTASRCPCAARLARKVWQVVLVVPRDGDGPPRTGWRREPTVCCYSCALTRIDSLKACGVYAEIAPVGEPRVTRIWRVYRERNARREA